MSRILTGGWLAGRKTYVAGALSLIGTAAAYLTGDLTLADALQTAIPTLLAMTVRHGIATDLRR